MKSRGWVQKEPQVKSKVSDSRHFPPFSCSHSSPRLPVKMVGREWVTSTMTFVLTTTWENDLALGPCHETMGHMPSVYPFSLNRRALT